MYLTEDEAKKTWCPQTPREFQPNGGLDSDSCCLASGCAVWQQIMEPYTPEGGDPLETIKGLRPSGEGYCGLAGNPED